ncbi:histidine kinase [uncultured Sphaerochaeta sp.]|uniref:sensor histidine kinase n=1 Tax=uncultured Sphaerochaeta sp. TaxID=886478 RepID=UPI002A0A3EEF|nr:histidine kinase [uncultured Sphaerochaeta sp.]
MNNKKRLLQIFIRHSLPLVIVVLLLGSTATLLTRNFLRMNSIEQANQTLKQASSYYGIILDEMDSLNLMFSTNPEMITKVQTILENGTLNLTDFREVKLIRSFLSAPANARPYIDGIYVYLDNSKGNVLSNDLGFIGLSSLYDGSWFSTYKTKLNGSQSFSEHIILRKGTPTEQAVIRIYRPITNVSGSPRGVIVLDLKETVLSQAYEKSFTYANEYLTVHNEQGQLLFASPSQPCPYPENKMQYFQIPSKKYGWIFTLGIYKPKLYALSTTLMSLTIALSLVALSLGLLLTHRTNRKERAFLSNIIQQLNNAGNLETEDQDQNENVFDYMNNHVIKTFIQQDYLRWQKEAMEYRALQMQINPHFLFNTLDTIYWKTIKLAEGETDVSKMIQILSKLLQYSLQVDDLQGTSLSKELEQTRYYVQLQKYRFKDSFVFHEDISEEVLNTVVPSMIFQPLLENSFNHGFIEGELLTISLSINKEDDQIKIILENDGTPLGEQELQNLNEEPIDVLYKKNSLGVLNSRKRLMLFFQGKAHLSFSSDGVRGITITITLPYPLEKEATDN